MIERAIHSITHILLALWWGGLTFYSAVVVPIGAQRFGANDQGFVTRDVTLYLNGLGAAVVVALMIAHWRSGGRALRVIIATLAAAAVMLILLHRQLDTLLDHETASVNASELFYHWHRLYLIVTTIQWLAGLGALLWRPTPTQRASSPQDFTS